MSTQINAIKTLINTKAKPRFLSLVNNDNERFIKEAGFAVQLLQSNNYLLKLAMGNPDSLIAAVTNIASMNTTLSPMEKQAYLVPYNGTIQLQISYLGLINLALEDGSITWAHADLVYEDDQFDDIGIDEKPVHRKRPFKKDRGEILGAYCTAKRPTGEYMTETMAIDEIKTIMQMSESVKRGKSSPWHTFFGEMAKKTVIKRASKSWYGSEKLQKAIEYLNETMDERLDFNATPAPVKPPEAVKKPKEKARLTLSDLLNDNVKQLPTKLKAKSESEAKAVSA